PAAGKTVGAAAVSIGPIGWVVIGVTVVGVGVGIALYNHYANSADKENESKTSTTAPSIKSPVTSGSPLPMNDPDDDRDKSNKNPFRGERDEPKTIYDKNGRPKQTRTYKEDGYPDVDIDYDHNHGQGQPHQHKWTRPENGPPTYKDRQPGTPLDPN
ncbi:MAG: hypothetical protein P1P64_00500, partial [Treponemataceae bacterium]